MKHCQVNLFKVTAAEYVATRPGESVEQGRRMTRQCVQWLVNGAQHYPGALVEADGDAFVVTLPNDGPTTRYTPCTLAPAHERHAEVLRRRHHLSLVDNTPQEGI